MEEKRRRGQTDLFCLAFPLLDLRELRCRALEPCAQTEPETDCEEECFQELHSGGYGRWGGFCWFRIMGQTVPLLLFSSILIGHPRRDIIYESSGTLEIKGNISSIHASNCSHFSPIVLFGPGSNYWWIGGPSIAWGKGRLKEAERERERGSEGRSSDHSSPEAVVGPPPKQRRRNDPG